MLHYILVPKFIVHLAIMCLFICTIPQYVYSVEVAQSGNVTEFYLFADFLFDLADFSGGGRGGELKSGGEYVLYIINKSLETC